MWALRESKEVRMSPVLYLNRFTKAGDAGRGRPRENAKFHFGHVAFDMPPREVGQVA